MKRKTFLKKINLNKFNSNFFTKNYLIVILSVVAVSLAIFIFLLNNYKEVLKVDIDGYMISTEGISSLKSEGVSEDDIQKIEVVKLKTNDSIYKNTLNHYVNSDKKSNVDIEYPLFVDNGFAIINYNSNVNLISNSFERSLGYENLVLSYGKIYDSTDYTQIDKETYLFLSYQDGVYVNLYDLKIQTLTNSYTIPTNSFLFFFENQINYYERSSEGFVRKTILDVDYESLITFYYDGGDEKFEYTYEDVLLGTGTIYIEEEVPDLPDIKPGDQDTEIEEEEVKPPVAEPDGGNGESVPSEPGERYWVKPEVKSSELIANVYSMDGSIKISDPAGVITKAPTYTFYVDNKVYSRRTYYNSGDIVITGLSADTNYLIVGQYTYLDKDFKTKKIVTFYTGSAKTKSMATLDPIELEFELGEIYSKKIEINNLGIISSLDSEAIRGVKKIALSINGENYFITSVDMEKLLRGEKISISTPESLSSNSEQNFEILFYDRNNFVITAVNNKGTTRTCKEEPVAFLTQLDSDNINIKIGIELRNKDNVAMSDYIYKVTDSSGRVIASDYVEGDNFTINNLDPDQIFKLRVTADVDLENGSGIVDDYLLGEMDLSTLPISSLGFVNLKVTEDLVNHNNFTLKLEMNRNKTDPLLIRILEYLTFNVYDSKTEELVYTKKIEGDELELLKSAKMLELYVDGLRSNYNYNIEFRSLVKQGSTEYDLDCVYNLSKIETRKKPAEVLILNSFTSGNMIDFDCLVVDDDGSILSNGVVVELRNENKEIVKTQVIDVNTDDYIRVTYDNLDERRNYTLTFYANEYNETNHNSTYVAKYTLKVWEVFTDDGISGKIELVSSLRKESGVNIADMHSELKWIETYHAYTIPKTIDEEGDIHIYSKNNKSGYSYDLSAYRGKMVTVSYKIKAITPVKSGYDVYFTNYLAGSDNTAYGTKLTNIGTDSWKSFTHTFVVGAQYNAANQVYYPVFNLYHGRYYTDFVGFYISGGTLVMSEYEIRDFEIHLAEDVNNSFIYDKSLKNVTISNKKIETASATTVTTSYMELEGGYYYKINTDAYNVRTILWNTDGNHYKTHSWHTRSNEWKDPDWLVFYVPNNKVAVFEFRGKANESGIYPELGPDDVNFEITKFKKSNDNPGFQKFEYTLDTKVSVDVTDVRGEITNQDYFIKVYENGNEVNSYNYVELTDSYKLENVIKNIDLEENKFYIVELGIKIRDRYYALSSFEIETNGEVMGISTTSDWSFIQPRGNYILLNDLSFKDYTAQIIGFTYRYFYGSIDFQGYTMSLYTSSDAGATTTRRIGRVESTGVLKNLVLDIHLDNDVKSDLIRGFVDTNYGTIENVEVNVYDYTPSDKKPNLYFSTLCYSNQRTGVIRNFVLNLGTDIALYHESAGLVNNNYGTIENGYIYGNDAIATPDPGGTSRKIALLQKYGGSRSVVNKVFSLSNIIYKTNNEYDVTGALTWETYGKVSNSFSTGTVNNVRLEKGPVVGEVKSTAETKNLYYMNETVYTNSYQQKVGPTVLNDANFYKTIFGDSFNIDEMVDLGYYPHVNYSSNKMPSQPYIELPIIKEDNLVDIVSMNILEQSNNDAIVEFYVHNPEGENISEISIADLSVEILSQTYQDGKSIVKARLYNPRTYISRYQIRMISSVNFLGYTSSNSYDGGEKYADVSFYHEINNLDDWVKINDGLNQNYALMTDLDFFGFYDFYIGNFSGKIEGNNHVIKNFDIIKAGKYGIFNQMNGTLQNIYIENVYNEVNTVYHGIAGSSNQYGKFINVHVKNMTIIIPSSKTADTIYAGAFVGSASSSRIQDSSVTDLTISSDVKVNNVTIGGLIGYSSASNISTSYAQNVKLTAINSMSMNGIGGLVGREASANGYIQFCYSTGNITNDALYTGGLVGYAAGYIENSYSAVNIESSLDYVGGIAGYSDGVDDVNSNLFVGNIYNPKGLTGRIVSNYVVHETNFALDSSLINGVISDLNNGETFISKGDLLYEDTYLETLLWTNEFDYSKSSEEILPKLFYLGTNTLLPNQLDNKLYDDILDITNVVVDKHADYANVVIHFNNPEGYIVENIVIDNMTTEITRNVSVGDITTIELKATPQKFFDSYKFSKIYYKETPDSTKTKSFDKFYKIDMTFYKSITKFEDWQAVSKIDAENYLLMNDIDFTGKTNVNLQVLFNRLETVSDDEVHTLKGITIDIAKNTSNVSIIQSVSASIKNINFENIKITDTSTGANNYINLIRYNYGNLENLSFKDITIDAVNENYAGIVGRNYGMYINNINLNNVVVKGRSYVSALFAYAENLNERVYSNITANNIDVYGGSNYVGGIFGYVPNTHSLTNRYVTNINVIDSKIQGAGSYTGGIAGVGEANDSLVQRTEVIGVSYVGGMLGQQKANYINNNEVRDSSVIGSGERIGGMVGHSYYIYDSSVINTTITSTSDTTFAVGGLVGYFNAYDIIRCGIIDSIITGPGYAQGGIVGHAIGNNEIYYSFVENSIVNGSREIGGIVGSYVDGYVRYDTVTKTLVNATDSYAGGIIGKFNNIESNNGFITQVYVTDTDVRSNMFAGGFTGGLVYPLFYVNEENYSLYFEGNVQSTVEGTAGLGSGDSFNKDILNLPRVYAYEKSTINGEKLDVLADTKEGVVNISNTVNFKPGYINNDGTEVGYHTSYPNASYSDFITLEAGKSYKFDITHSAGYTWFDFRIYDKNGKYIGRPNDSASRAYVGYTRSVIYFDEHIVTVTKECKIKVIIIDVNNVQILSLREVEKGSGALLNEQLLNYNDLRDQVTWTNYLYTGSHNYSYSTKLNLTFDRYDFTKLKANMKGNKITDLSGNNAHGTGNVSSINSDGALFDGIDDEIRIQNYKATPSFTISMNINLYSDTANPYEFLFSSEDFDETSNGIGLFVHSNMSLYLRINGTNYELYKVPRFEECNVTVTYDQTQILVYLNGTLVNTLSKKPVVKILDSSVTKIAPSYVYSDVERRYDGIIRTVQVYDRAISGIEVQDNYHTDSVTNSEGLKIYYDFSNENYYSEVGNYPTLKSNDSTLWANYQTPTELPTDTNRDGIQNLPEGVNLTTFASSIKLLDKKISDSFNVYSSSVNTVNIEFDDVYDDISFRYKNGDYVSSKQDISKRVYTLSYNYLDDLEIDIISSNDSETFVYKKEDLARKLNLSNDSYYHINDDVLYSSETKIIDNALHIYGNLVLTKEKGIYDIVTNKYLNSILKEGIYSKSVPLYEFNTENSNIKTFYNHSIVTDKDGYSVIRRGQLFINNGYMYLFDSNDSVKQDMNVFNNYNTSSYQISLIDGELVPIMNDIKYPRYFGNNNIVETAFDINSGKPILMVRYNNDYIVAFDYYQGKELFTYGSKVNVSLFDFVFSSFSSNDSIANSNITYKDSNDLILTLNSLTNQEVKDKLNVNSGTLDSEVDYGDSNNPDSNLPVEDETITNDGSTQIVELTKIKDSYIKVYDYDTEKYEVYSVGEILSSTNDKLLSSTYKINNDTFLYNYFYENKVNVMDKTFKIVIYLAIIAIVIVNLFLFAKYVSHKEVGNND